MAREITYNNFEMSLVVFMPNITTNHAITYTYGFLSKVVLLSSFSRKLLVDKKEQKGQFQYPLAS